MGLVGGSSIGKVSWQEFDSSLFYFVVARKQDFQWLDIGPPLTAACFGNSTKGHSCIGCASLQRCISRYLTDLYQLTLGSQLLC